jgi:hypothetical protein
MMKRLVLAAMVAATSLGVAVPQARAEGATKVEFPNLSFTVTPERCNQIPGGTEIDGTGSGRWIYTTRTDKNGAEHYREEARYSGTATDQDGNTYKWNYSSYFVSVTTAAGDVSGYIVDTFVLAGSPLGYVTRFRADISPTGGFDPVWVLGDPFDFDALEGRCDPL